MSTPFIRIRSISISSSSITSVDSTSQDPELLRRLLRAKDRMDAASHEDWPVQRLARVSRVSEAHFARSFKQAFGLPPHRYLLTRRIERATALLRDTDRLITEIAFDTGWRKSGNARTYLPRRHRREPGREPRRTPVQPLLIHASKVFFLQQNHGGARGLFQGATGRRARS
jgi:transcriptional regulator GlxA family with amidase domain